MLRVQQLEAEFPSIEKAFLSQTNPSPLAFNEGIDWRANLRMDQNLVTRGDMPRFILDSYEECRGPPRLFMLDKFDVAGAGACLKRYSDPSFFKVDLASSGMMEEGGREKKVRKLKKKGSRWRNSETTKSFLAPFIRSNLQPVISEQISAKVPMRHIKLKSRNLMDSDISNKRSYMEHLLEVHSPEKKVIDQVASVELHETVTNTAVNSPILKKRNGIQSPAKLPIHEVADQKIKDIAVFTPSVPDEKVMIESQVKKAVTVHDYNSNEAEKYSPAILEADQQKDIVDTHISIADGFDGHGSAEKNRTDAILDGYCSRVEVDPSCLLLVDQKNSFSNLVFSSKGGFDGYRSDDVGSELENYMDALNTMESEIETDSESRQKSDPGILDMEAHRIDEFNKRQRELPAQFSEPDDLGDLTEKGLNNMLISLPSMSENSGTLSDTQLPQEDLINFYVPVIPEICLSEHVRTVDELPTISRLEESIPSAHLLTNDTCNANGSEAMSAQVGTVRAYSSSCFPDSTSSGDRVCPPATGEAQSVTIHPTETFSGYVEGDHQAGQQLNGNMEELSTYAGNSNMSPDELLLLSDTGCSLLGEEDAREEIHADEVPSVVHPPNETFLGVENTDETCEQLTAKEEVLKFPDNYDSNELLLSPETEGSFSNSIGFLKETHPGKSPNEMSDRSMLGNLSLTQGCCSLNEAPVQFDETILLTKEKFSHIEREEKSSIEQETEALTGESISPTIPSLSAKNISAVVKSGDLAADMDVIEIPGNFAAEMSSNNGRLSHGVGENLDENLPCTVHTSEPLSQDHDGMESLKPATSSTISSDDLLSESVVPQRADIAEDSGELFSQDMGDTQGDSFLKEVPTWSLKDPITLFTEEGTETCSGTMLPATNFELFIETSPIVLHPGELAAKVDNSTASSEDLFNANVGGTKIVMPNLLPVELEQLSAAEQPQKCHEMDLAELSSGASANNAFPDGTDLQSAEPVCMVTGGNNFVADTGGFPRGPTTSNLPEEEHIEKNMKCDKLLDEYVIVEADDCNQGSCSIYSPNGSVFDIELQDDYLPGSADIDSHNLETDEMSYPKSTIVTPQIDNQTMSSTALCSEFPIAGSSYSSDAKLSDGVCQTMSSEPDVGNGSSLFLSESEDSFSRGSMDGSNHFLVEPAIPLVDDNEGNVTSLNQEGKHLEASDIQFDRAFSDEQTISQGNPKDIDNQTLKLDPYAILTTVEMNAFDTRYELREVEAVPSESTSKVSAGSMTSDIFPIIATSSSGISETRAPECLERQPVEAIFSLQSQDVEGTSPLPPLPPVPEFLESNVVEAASSLQLQDVEGLPPLPPLPPVPEFLEPKVVEAASSLHVQDVEETLPLPPLPPVEWRMGNLRYGCLRSVGDTAQPPKAANTFMALSPLDAKHPQVSVTAGFEMVQPTTSPLWKDERVPQGSLNSEGESRHAELPPIADKDGLNHGMNPPNLFLPVSHSENERYSGAHDAGMLVVEEKITQHQEQLQGAQSIEDKRPRLGQLVPSLELERSKHESTGIGAPVVPLNPFLPVSSSEEFKHQYGYGVYGGESLQHLNLSPPLPVTGPNMLPYGFLYKMRENPSMIFDFMVPSTEVERPSCKHRSIRDRPRNPLIEAVAAHDKSKLRKVSELDPPQNRPKADERDSLLEQIRNKSFNLKPVNAPKVNIKGPPTNLKLAAILEKANAIRQAFVGSDEDDDDDGESWNGS
ncbi:putative SCAR-like protein 1 [Iris pallida]|uniref:Protein SCAR n=1 Tax=Iris pallida TaxID=29817 RepID=A0AAX6GQP4_IRIPA|nr:putative SCAR-like protein 1 [Iris pallida]